MRETNGGRKTWLLSSEGWLAQINLPHAPERDKQIKLARKQLLKSARTILPPDGGGWEGYCGTEPPEGSTITIARRRVLPSCGTLV